MEFFELSLSDVEGIIRDALAEDEAYNDITSASCVEKRLWAKGKVILKQRGCIAGLKFLPWILGLHDQEIRCSVLVREGDFCEKGTLLAEVEGPAWSILSGERVALNFLQHLCGIATLTARCVEKVKGTKCKILDTRKTIAGLRRLQKYAVRIGGGTNHRPHLAGQILIKNNHLSLAGRDQISPLFFCIRMARERHPKSWIEVEIGRPEEINAAIDAGADAILLDNMSPEEVKMAVSWNQGRVFLEASGGIGLDTLEAYAATGIDAVSIGALTHSAPAADISLRLY